MRLKSIVILSLLFLFSCKDKNAIPKGILKPDLMQKVLWDVLQADAFAFNYITKDTAKKPEAENIQLQQKIFAVHKISKEEFYKSYEFYKAHPDIMQPIMDSMITYATQNKYIAPLIQPVTDTLKPAQ